MTKTQIIAKAMLLCLGIYFLAYAGSEIYGSESMFNSVMSDEKTHSAFSAHQINIAIITWCCALGASAVATAVFLILYNDSLIKRLDKDSSRLTQKECSLWLAASLRMACVLSGLVLLRDRIGLLRFMSRILLNLPEFTKALARTFDSPDPRLREPGIYVGVALELLWISLTIYLLIGAPQYVRWQLNRAKAIDSKGGACE